MTHSLPCTDPVFLHDCAERYAMGRMSRTAHARYEEHLLICPPCQEAVAEFDVFLASMRGAATPEPGTPWRAAAASG